MALVAQFKSLSTTKKALYIFGLLVIVGTVYQTYLDNTPEALAAKERSIAAHKEAVAQQQAEFNDLLGTNCEKTGTAKIGESQTRTLNCGWGKPDRINRTTTPDGVIEQWVYGRSYLTYANGRLITIQN